jgi:glutathione S-transferase
MAHSNTEPHVTYFYSPGACSFVPYTAICEIGVEVELVLAKVGAMSEEFLKINPKRRVPVVVIGENIVTEMAAVLTAVSSLAPEHHLLGHTTEETIRVYEWLNYLSTVAHNQAMAQIWRTERFTNDLAAYPSIQAKGREVIQEVYALIDEKLGSRGEAEYVVGNSLTVVDPFIVVVYLWSRKLGFNVRESYPIFAAYAERHLRKESFAKSAKLHEFV